METVHDPAIREGDDRPEDDERDPVLHRRQGGPDRPVEGPRDDRPEESARDDVDIRDEEERGAQEHRVMEGADTALAEHARLEECVPDEAPRALREGARAARAALDVRGREDAQPARNNEREDSERAPEDREDERIGRDICVRLEHQPGHA